MMGRMQDWPLLMHKIIDFAAIQHPEREIASRMVEGPMHRTNYREIRERALKAAKRLERDGIKLGDRVATLAWNGFRHLESWYGIAGIGAVYHTVNPRLFPDQIAWIINDAEDRIVMTDLTFVPLLEALADRRLHARLQPEEPKPHPNGAVGVLPVRHRVPFMNGTLGPARSLRGR
jgi:fatty-acyl-CoA synthase